METKDEPKGKIAYRSSETFYSTKTTSTGNHDKLARIAEIINEGKKND